MLVSCHCKEAAPWCRNIPLLKSVEGNEAIACFRARLYNPLIACVIIAYADEFLLSTVTPRSLLRVESEDRSAILNRGHILVNMKAVSMTLDYFVWSD